MDADTTLPLDAPTATVASAPASEPVEGPRIRWAGMVWGLMLAALAASALVVVGSAESRDAIRDGILRFDFATINPGTVWGAIVLVLGVVLLLTGGIALLRHAQHRGDA